MKDLKKKKDETPEEKVQRTENLANKKEQNF